MNITETKSYTRESDGWTVDVTATYTRTEASDPRSVEIDGDFYAIESIRNGEIVFSNLIPDGQGYHERRLIDGEIVTSQTPQAEYEALHATQHEDQFGNIETVVKLPTGARFGPLFDEDGMWLPAYSNAPRWNPDKWVLREGWTTLSPLKDPKQAVTKKKKGK